MEIKPIPSIPGALAREDGMIKLPEREYKMPNGGTCKITTKWIRGVLTRARKTARCGYYATRYRDRNYKIHRLICEAFHGPQPPDKPIVLHLNENSQDNRPENMRWGTQKENLNFPGFIAYCKSRTAHNSPSQKGKINKLRAQRSEASALAPHPSDQNKSAQFARIMLTPPHKPG